MWTNVGIVDRLLRLIGLHFLISVKDIDVIQSYALGLMVMLLGFYCLATLLIGFDPIYKLLNINTKEPKTQTYE